MMATTSFFFGIFQLAVGGLGTSSNDTFAFTQRVHHELVFKHFVTLNFFVGLTSGEVLVFQTLSRNSA